MSFQSSPLELPKLTREPQKPTHEPPKLDRGKILFDQISHLFNFVAGRWDLELFDVPATEPVLIGKQVKRYQVDIYDRLQSCERSSEA